jgi:polysaccharide export outer membrane protein
MPAHTPLARLLLPGALLLVFGSAGACYQQKPFVWVQDVPAPAPVAGPIIEARDTLLVDVREHTELSGEFPVREDGHYLQPGVGSIRVSGISPAQASTIVAAALRGTLNDARVAIWISKPAPIRVNVVGEVRTPGAYELTRDRGVAAALAAAGWVTEFAGRDRIYVVRVTDKETRIRFRLAEIVAPEVRSALFRLHDGDIVVVE